MTDARTIEGGGTRVLENPTSSATIIPEAVPGELPELENNALGRLFDAIVTFQGENGGRKPEDVGFVISLIAGDDALFSDDVSSRVEILESAGFTSDQMKRIKAEITVVALGNELDIPTINPRTSEDVSAVVDTITQVPDLSLATLSSYVSRFANAGFTGEQSRAVRERVRSVVVERDFSQIEALINGGNDIGDPRTALDLLGSEPLAPYTDFVLALGVTSEGVVDVAKVSSSALALGLKREQVSVLLGASSIPPSVQGEILVQIVNDSGSGTGNPDVDTETLPVILPYDDDDPVTPSSTPPTPPYGGSGGGSGGEGDPPHGGGGVPDPDSDPDSASDPESPEGKRARVRAMLSTLRDKIVVSPFYLAKKEVIETAFAEIGAWLSAPPKEWARRVVVAMIILAVLYVMLNLSVFGGALTAVSKQGGR